MQDIATELSQPIHDVTAVITSEDAKGEISAAIERDESAVERILAAAGLDSVYTLITLRDQAKTETVRYNAAKTLLEQGHGKPLAKVKQIIEDATGDPVEEAARLKQELGLAEVS